MDMHVHPTTETALADWSRRVRTRAASNDRLDVPDVKKITPACPLVQRFTVMVQRCMAQPIAQPGAAPAEKIPSAALVTHWLRGECAPENAELHVAVLNALSLPTCEEDGKNSGAKALIQHRWNLNVLYGLMPDRYKTAHPGELAELKGKPRSHICIGNGTFNVPVAHIPHHHERTSAYDDRAGVPLRRKPPHMRYAELGTSELDTLLGNGPDATMNAHEFLCAFAAHYGLSGAMMEEVTGLDASFINSVRTGGRMPDKALPAFQKMMDSYDTRYFPRFKALLISNRLSVAAEMRRLDNAAPEAHDYAGSITNEYNRIPPAYWQAMMLRHTHPKAALPAGSPPDWLLKQQPLLTRSDYLRAARCAFDLDVEDVCMEPKVRLHPSLFCRVEHYGNAQDNSGRERLADFYRGLDAARIEASGEKCKPWFDMNAYHRLPNNKKTHQPAPAQLQGTLDTLGGRAVA